MAKAGITIPNDSIPASRNKNDRAQTEAIEKMSQKLWNLSLEEQRVSLAVLSELCDALV
jgi:hypothetical protein